MRKILTVIGIWLLPSIVIFAFPRDLPGFTCLAKMSFPLIGLGLAIYFAIALVWGKQRRQSAIALILVLLIGSIGYAKGFKWGTQLHLLVNEGRYQATITKLRTAKSDSERKQICGADCQVMSSEPLRVTFHYCHCFLHWPDIVYDPTGAVNDTDITKLHQLDVYLFGAEPLKDNWYLGKFGD